LHVLAAAMVAAKPASASEAGAALAEQLEQQVAIADTLRGNAAAAAALLEQQAAALSEQLAAAVATRGATAAALACARTNGAAAPGHHFDGPRQQVSHALKGRQRRRTACTGLALLQQ
jgi:hypothetical protein